MHIDGQCLCGQVTYEADIDPERIAICYCADCQRSSASAYRIVAGVEGESFRLLTGTLKTWVKTADSGNKRELAFCPECGTNLYGKPVGEKGSFFSLRAGTVNQRADLSPKLQVWCASRPAWVQLVDGIPAYDRGILK
jgi:hypothetical protein